MSIDEISSESILLHPLRRSIYSLVCQTPGSNFSMIARALDTSSSTLNWHLKRLEKAGYLKSGKFGGKRIYYPASLRTETAEEIIQILSNKTARKIFLFVVNSPEEECYSLNISRNLNPALHHETVRYHLDRMKKVNLVETIKNGNTLFIRPGMEAYSLKEHGMNVITDSYIDYLFESLRNDCLYPEIVERKSDKLVLRIECPDGEEIQLDIHLSEWDFKINKENKDQLSTSTLEEN